MVQGAVVSELDAVSTQARRLCCALLDKTRRDLIDVEVQVPQFFDGLTQRESMWARALSEPPRLKINNLPAPFDH